MAAPRSLAKIACLHSFSLKKHPHGDEEEEEGGGTSGRLGGKAPCYFLCPMLERFCRNWHLSGFGSKNRLTDVSHFRMDSTMCGMPPFFFLFL